MHMLKLNVYAHDAETGRTSQTEVAKTVTAETYDLMYGTIEDILGLLDAVSDNADENAIIRAVSENWGKLTILLLDVFPQLTRDDLRHIKVREVVPVMVELFRYVVASFGGNKDGLKNA